MQFFLPLDSDFIKCHGIAFYSISMLVEVISKGFRIETMCA